MQPDDHGATESADFDETFRESYWPMVRSLAVACGDRTVAEDAVQDAFERAFVRWRRIAHYDDPAGWIRHVALNRMRDHHRRDSRKHQAVARFATETETMVPPPELPGDVDALLAQLPEQQRIAAALFYVEDLSVRDVATSMNLSEGAVKFHLHAARAALAQQVRTR